MMSDSLRPLPVVDPEGRVAGYVSIELINQTLHAAEGPSVESSAVTQD